MKILLSTLPLLFPIATHASECSGNFVSLDGCSIELKASLGGSCEMTIWPPKGTVNIDVQTGIENQVRGYDPGPGEEQFDGTFIANLIIEIVDTWYESTSATSYGAIPECDRAVFQDGIGDNVLQVNYGPIESDEGDVLASALTVIDPSTQPDPIDNDITHGIITISTSNLWFVDDEDENEYDLKGVLTHEIGHILHLRHVESGCDGAVMKQGLSAGDTHKADTHRDRCRGSRIPIQSDEPRGPANWVKKQLPTPRLSRL